MKDYNYKDVILLEELGKGGFGIVRKAYHKRKCQYIAIKKLITIEDEDALNNILLEHSFLENVENICQKNKEYSQCFLNYDGIFKDTTDNNKVFYVLQMENGICTLEDLLKAGKKYTAKEMLYVIKTLIDGFALLEENGIANRDVKPPNVILVEDPVSEEEFLYKISDFGIGCAVPKNSANKLPMMSISGFTKLYAAPEILDFYSKEEDDILNSNYTYNPFKCDVFSLGFLAIKMINYKIQRQQIDQGIVLQNNIEELKENPDIAQLIEEMLMKDPEKRPNFLQLKEKILIILEKLNLQGSKNKLKAIKPAEEFKYYQIYESQKEEKERKEIKSAINLYQYHYEFYKIYRDDVSRHKMSKYHLDQAFEILQNIKELEKKSNQQENNSKTFDHEKEFFVCLFCYGKYFLYQNDLNTCQMYLNKGLEILRNFAEFQEKNIDKIIDKEPDFRNKKENTIIKNLSSFQESKDNSNSKRNLDIIADLCGNYGELYNNLGNLNKAEEFYKKSMEIKLEIFGEHHSETADAFNNMGSLYCDKGELEKAEEYYKKSLEITLGLFGENSDAAITMNNLGSLYQKMGNLKNTEEYFKKGLEIKIKLFGEKHKSTAISYNNLGSFYYYQGNLVEAEKYYKKALEVYIDLYGENYSFTAITYNNLGSLYEDQKEFDKAQEFYEKSLKIKIELFGENHPDTANSYNNLGLFYKYKGNPSKGEEYLQKSSKIQKEISGKIV